MDLLTRRKPFCLRRKELWTKTLRVMKITTLLIVVCFYLSFGAGAYSQQISISQKNAGLEEILSEIEHQSGYQFFYNERLLQQAHRLNIDVSNISLEDALKQCFKDQPLSYYIVGKTIVIAQKKEQNSSVSSQKTIVKGIVKDEEGTPLPGAVVQIKGSSQGVITNSKGEFHIKASSDAILLVSFIGFKMQEVPLAGQSDLEITMELLTNEVESVDVLSTGYQKISTERTTGSFSTISSQEIESNPNINIMDRLKDKLPGVRVDVENNEIQIRGTNTYYGSRPPLVVIDGFPALKQSLADYPETELSGTGSVSTNNAILSALNPNDIESISFLKDASAAAIWGSQAANGVIVIETKKGRGRGENQPVVNFSTNLSISAPSDLSKLDVMSSSEYIDLEKEIFDLGFVTDPTSGWRYANESDAMTLMFAHQRGEISEDQMNEGLSTLANRDNRSQIKDYLLRESVTQQYNLSVSGNNEKTQYYISGGYSDNQPAFRSNNSNQYSVTANITTKLFNDRITLATGINETFSKSKVNSAAIQAMTPGTFGLRPYDMLVDENGNSIDRYLKFTPDVIDDFSSKGYMPWTYNTLDELNYNNTIYNKDASRINTRLSGEVTNWLSASISGSYQRLNTEWRKLENEDSYSTRDLINEGTTIDANGQQVYGVPTGGIYKTSNTFSEDYSIRGQLDFNKSWSNIHRLSIIAGSEIRESKAHGYKQTRYGYDELTSSSKAYNPTTPYDNIYGYTFVLGYYDGSVFQSRQRYLSYYSNANYTFLNRYFFSGSLRFDDTNMLGVNRRNRAEPLWSAGFKWRVWGEKFMKKADFLDRLDLRLSYGTGGTAPKEGSNVSTISITGNDYYTGLPYGSLYLGNRDLGWEKTKTCNVGLDIALFNQRLSSTFDVYSKRSSGILVSLPINGTYGQTDLTYNTGTLAGHGYEFSLEGVLVRTADWTWNLDFVFSYNTNEVTDNRFPNTITSPTSTSVIEGYPVDYLFTYRWAGLDEQGQSQIYNAEGEIITSDMSSISFQPEDFEYAGRKTPPYFGSLSSTIRYKQLSLYLQANYSMGNKVLVDNINVGQYPTSSYFSGFISNSDALVNRWRNPGDEAKTNIPGMEHTSFTSVDRYKYANINVISGSYIRMQRISLSYQMPSKVIQSLRFIQSMSIATSVENLGLIWTKNDQGLDPEHIFSGTYTSLPPSKRFSFSLNVSF